MFSKLAVAICITSAFAQWQPSVPVDNRTIAQIYAAAKHEHGSSNQSVLQVFLGGDAGIQGDGLRKAWKAAFPDIPLNLTIDPSKYLDSRIDRAYLVNENVADVAALQTLSDFPLWKQSNRLLYYKPPSFEDLLEGHKDFDGAYVPAFLNSFGSFFYDKSKCPTSSIPSSYASLIDPQWKGKLILTYPNDDDAIAYLFSLIVSRYGWDWFNALAANDVQWVRGTATPVFEFLRQHNMTNSSRCLSITQYGIFNLYGADFIASKDPSPPEQVLSWVQTAAILASTHRPETAKLFIAWLTSPEFQKALSGPNQPLGSHTSVSGASVLSSLNKGWDVSPYDSNITQITGYPVFEADRALIEKWKNNFESIIGTAQGQNPLVVYPNPPFEG